MKTDYVILALKNLKHRGIRSWLTLIGIVIGITAVISLITLGNALQAAIISQFGVSNLEIITIQAGGLNAYGPPGSGAVKKLTTKDAEAISKLSSVEKVIPRNIETVKVEYKNQMQIGYVASIPQTDDRKELNNLLDLKAKKGRLLEKKDSNNIVLGYNFQKKESNEFKKELSIGETLKINNQDFKIVGFLEKKGSFVIDNVILMNEDDLRKITDSKDEVDLIAVKVKKGIDTDRAKEEIEKLLRKRRNVKEGEEDFRVSTPKAALSTINNILSGVKIFIIIISSISIIVGAVGIINTMTTSVLERRKEIGIMKSIGARNSDIFFQFFIESGLLGLIGGIVGILLGLSIGYIGISAINNFIGSQIKMHMDIMLITLSLLGSFTIGSVAGIAPALKAAKQNPVEALRE